MAIKDNSTGQYSLFEIGGELRPYFNRGVSQPLWNERGRADNERHDEGSQGIWLYQGRRRGHGSHRPGCGYYASHRDETYGTSHEAAQEAARRNKKDGAAWAGKKPDENRSRGFNLRLPVCAVLQLEPLDEGFSRKPDEFDASLKEHTTTETRKSLTPTIESSCL